MAIFTKNKYRLSDRASGLRQSGIRAMSTRCSEVKGINLGQGVCDIPANSQIKQAAFDAISSDKNIYAPCEGVTKLREIVAEKINAFNKIPVETKNVLITNGATGGFLCAVQVLFNPGDEVILFEPFYGYHRYTLSWNGISIKTVAINMENYAIDFDELKAAIGPKTKAIVVCTPCNPCGKVFTKEELLQIGRLAREHDLYLITDEIYEYITYPGYQHISIASLEDFSNRTITLSGFSKTYNITGWRLGYASGPEEIIAKMALLHDLIYVCPPTPLQYAMITALGLADNYYETLRDKFLRNRDLICDKLQKLGLKFALPQGAYYILADFSEYSFHDDEHAAISLLEGAKVAVVPGGAFYLDPNKGAREVRVCYALNEDKLRHAADSLQIMLQK